MSEERVGYVVGPAYADDGPHMSSHAGMVNKLGFICGHSLCAVNSGLTKMSHIL